MLRIAVLVSVGGHPVSGRARRATRDAQAVELALRIPGAVVELVHAGDPEQPALRDYLGMGVGRIRVVAQPPGADIVPALASYLRVERPDLILAGTRAEAGEGSGLVPYLIAEALRLPIVAAIADCGIEAGGARLLQALPRGRRHGWSAPLPVVATVDRGAPAPRPVAYGPARRGRIEATPVPTAADAAPDAWARSPARRRPRRLKGAVGGSAEERVRAATQLADGGGQVLVGPRPEDAARAIWDFLVREGIVAPAEGEGTADAER